MNFLFGLFGAAALFGVTAALLLYGKLMSAHARLRTLELDNAGVAAEAENLRGLATEMAALRKQNTEYLEQKSIAQTQRNDLEKSLQAAHAERQETLRMKDAALTAKLEAEKATGLMEQRLSESEKRMKDWETQRDEHLKASKASIMEIGNQLSSKLLEDHKREQETAKKESEEAVKKTSESLVEKVNVLGQSVASIQQQTKDTGERMATVWKSLSTPGGAGNLAEIGLENSLKNLSLQAGQDYVMQYSITSQEHGKFRPDAVIFLPQDMVMVIDSKASKSLLEIADAVDDAQEAEAMVRLKNQMNTHLKQLTDKSYGAAVASFLREQGRGERISAVLNVMYLPSDQAVNLIKRADPEFIHKVEQAGIVLAGPGNLLGLLSLARISINISRQAENQELIVRTMQEFMDNVITLFGHADKVGKGLKSAADGYNQFAKSANSRILSKMRRFLALGVHPLKAGELPKALQNYEMTLAHEMITIDAEPETSVIEPFPRKVSA